MWALVASDNQFWGPTRGRALVLQHVCTYSWKLRSLSNERYIGTTRVNRNIYILLGEVMFIHFLFCDFYGQAHLLKFTLRPLKCVQLTTLSVEVTSKVTPFNRQ